MMYRYTAECERTRDPEAERRERLSYILMQHIRSLERESAGELVAGGISTNLALEPREATELLSRLARAGLILWDGSSAPAHLTQAGLEYLDRGAGRRRSVRLFSSDWP